MSTEYHPSNREKSQVARVGRRFWCGRCDAGLRGTFGKCPNCGYVEFPKKMIRGVPA